jgi:hypothetical protein
LQESMRELGFSNVYYFNFYHTWEANFLSWFTFSTTSSM